MTMCWAIIKTSFYGKHKYPDAPIDVAFLRELHPHAFHVTVWLEQEHNSRDIEYFQFKEWLDLEFDSLEPEPSENCSCEDYCDIFRDLIWKKYSDRKLKIEVTEDGNHGALKEY